VLVTEYIKSTKQGKNSCRILIGKLEVIRSGDFDAYVKLILDPGAIRHENAHWT